MPAQETGACTHLLAQTGWLCPGGPGCLESGGGTCMLLAHLNTLAFPTSPPCLPLQL